MCTPAYDAPGPLFRAADHHNELMDLASRHDCHHPIDHTTPGDPYAEYRNADDGYDPADDDDDEEGDDRDFDDRDEAAIDNLYEGDAFQRRLEASWAADDAPAEDPAPSPKPTLRDLTTALRESNLAVIGELNMILHRMTTTLGTLTTDCLDDYLDAIQGADKKAYEDYIAARRERDVLWDAILAVINKR